MASLLLLEDDVVFHPNFSRRVKELELPEDWGIFYFGCQHLEPPQAVSPGVVRVRRALDTHAVGIRAEHFYTVRAAMRGGGKGAQGNRCSDALLSSLHKFVPTYAAYPNLAWQREIYSDLRQKIYSNYFRDGRQKRLRRLLTAINI
jgi:hypothetical protein